MFNSETLMEVSRHRNRRLQICWNPTSFEQLQLSRFWKITLFLQVNHRRFTGVKRRSGFRLNPNPIQLCSRRLLPPPEKEVVSNSGLIAIKAWNSQKYSNDKPASSDWGCGLGSSFSASKKCHSLAKIKTTACQFSCIVVAVENCSPVKLIWAFNIIYYWLCQKYCRRCYAWWNNWPLANSSSLPLILHYH